MPTMASASWLLASHEKNAARAKFFTAKAQLRRLQSAHKRLQQQYRDQKEREASLEVAVRALEVRLSRHREVAEESAGVADKVLMYEMRNEDIRSSIAAVELPQPLLITGMSSGVDGCTADRVSVASDRRRYDEGDGGQKRRKLDGSTWTSLFSSTAYQMVAATRSVFSGTKRIGNTEPNPEAPRSKIARKEDGHEASRCMVCSQPLAARIELPCSCNVSYCSRCLHKLLFKGDPDERSSVVMPVRVLARAPVRRHGGRRSTGFVASIFGATRPRRHPVPTRRAEPKHDPEGDGWEPEI